MIDVLKERILILDGAMGTELIRRTGKKFEFPEVLNVENPDLIREIHEDYIAAGADIIETNTFGANRIKLQEFGASNRVMELNAAAVRLAREARGTRRVFIAGSMGPIGKLIRPLGELTEEEVYDVYKEQAIALAEGGVDLLLIETQIDILEAKIAARAAKDATDLPVAVSISYPIEGGLTVTGSDPEVAAVTFAATDVDIFGLNCGGHPQEFFEFIEKINRHSSKPLIVYANAGIPEKRGDRIIYPLGPDEYLRYPLRFYELGANIIGGCCGTTPDHIRLIADALKGKKPARRNKVQPFFRASSRNSVIFIGKGLKFRIIGENINPYGKKRLTEELNKGELKYARELARIQEESGSHAIDVNLGRRGEKDAAFFSSAIRNLQNVTKLPLFIDNSSEKPIEMAFKVYAGKPVLNSISGENADRLLPIAKRYGAAVVLLAMDERGIPSTPEERVKIINNLVKKALDSGLTMNDLIADPVVLTISTSRENLDVTLKTLKALSDLGIPTIAGLSNLSYGLPGRKFLNRVFLPIAIWHGLDSAIMNPLDDEMINLVHASDALSGRDPGMKFYIEKYGKHVDIRVEEREKKARSIEEELFNSVVEGERGKTVELTEKLIKSGKNAFDVLNGILIPAMQKVGELYEKRVYFLPQLILSAEAMEGAAKVLEGYLKIDGRASKKAKIVMATVKGDLHDIGKNIVSLVLRNYGYEVIDLGKNVSAEKIVNAARDAGAEFIGLSALMTTTMDGMKDVIDLKKKVYPQAKVLIGGAAVNEKFAREIGADAYARDAIEAVKKVEELMK